MQHPVIFHIDVNSAFLSWTAAYRKNFLADTVDLREIPSAIVGDKDSRHSIVLAKSMPAKKYGVQTGEPLYEALQKCPTLTTAEPDYRLYSQASRRFIALLQEFTPQVEQFSIDEAWVDMTGTTRLYGNPVLAAQTIKDQIWEKLGFSVNIGISTNKLLAKIASDFEKPNRVHTLFPSELKEKFWPLPVRDLFLVGAATERKLRHMGIYTIGDLAKANVAQIKQQLNKPGEQLWHYANGRCPDGVCADQIANKGYGNSTTLPSDITEYEDADRVLLSLCETVGMRLRKDKKAACCVAVRIRTNQFRNAVHQRQLHGATDNTQLLYHAVQELLRQMWDRNQPLRQLGVQVTKLAAQSYCQFDLFEQTAAMRETVVDGAVDEIRQKYGEQAIVRAVFLKEGMQSMAGGLSPDRRTGVTKPLGEGQTVGRPNW